MNKQYECAKALIDQKFSIIPLYKDEKYNGDEEIVDRDYTLDHLLTPLLNEKKKLLKKKKHSLNTMML